VNPGWRAENWGNRADSQIVTGPNGKKMLSVTWHERDKDKVAVRLNVDLDLTDKSELSFDVYNESGGRISICAAFSTMPGYQFFESVAPAVPSGEWQTIRINLADKKFKSAASNWAHVTGIENKNNVRDVFILIYNGRNETGTLFINNIHIQ